MGLNGTRLFTVLYGGKVLKVGRVQTPTLAMLVEDDKAQAESIAAACESRTVTVVSVIKETKTVQPPKLYDLTTLQRDANRLFGFTAKQTLEYTQSLYKKSWLHIPVLTASIYQTKWKIQQRL